MALGGAPLLKQLSDDFDAAARAVGYVIPGDSAGTLIPFVPTPPQEHVFKTVREILAFRYVEQVRHLPIKMQREAWDIIWERDARPKEPGFAVAWRRAADYGPQRAIRL